MALLGCASAQPGMDSAAAAKAADRHRAGICQTMAERDHAAFASFIADEARVLMGGKPLRGKAAVVGELEALLQRAEGTVSSRGSPITCSVLDSGGLAIRPVPCSTSRRQTIRALLSTWPAAS